MKIIRRVVLLAVVAAVAGLAIKAVFANPKITEADVRYAWSAFTVAVAGVAFFVIDFILDDWLGL